MAFLKLFIVAVGLFVSGGSLLSLSQHPHWCIRMWDFPRAHIATVAALSGGLYALFFCAWQWYEWLFLSVVILCVVWQCYKIFPYTLIAPVQVKQTRLPGDDSAFRLVITNVLMQNRQYHRLLTVVQEVDPDVILAVEIDTGWSEQLQSLERTHPYVVRQPQDNMYGIMLLSRLPLIEPQIRFMVQDDIPSIHTGIVLRNGTQIVLHGLHPRPPEPLRDQHATPRDAELVLVGRDIGDEKDPVIVAGDLNDVAWSHTTELFLRLSHLLDPRKGRGFYNTYNANYPWFRFPLDHVFHSNCFKLISLHRLEKVGSDHFPIAIELRYEPEAAAEQPPPEADPEQEYEAQEKIDRAVEEEGSLEKC
jgi:endonuclease/exonuclease/phosphatase (EEP) superfamily protein YafD